MSLKSLGNQHFEFGLFRLDTRARLLFRDGVPVALQPKSYETLLFLVRQRGRAVTRQELFEAVWPGVVVSEGSLTQTVFLLRKALGVTEDGREYIETVPRVGYRFAGEVREAEGAAASGPAATAPAAAGPSRRRWLLAAAAAVLAALLPWLMRRQGTAPAPVPGSAVPRRPEPITLRRELPVPVDAERVLAHVDGSFVLGAPGALYLLPEDGALAATRIALAPDESVAGMTAQGLAVVKGAEVVTRHAVKQKERGRATLPARPGPGDTCLISPDGRFLAVRGAGAVEVLQLRDKRYRPAFRVPMASDPDDVLTLTARHLGLAPGRGGTLRVFRLEDGKPALEAPFDELRPRALAIDDATGSVAVCGAFDAVLVYRIGGPPLPQRLPRRGWTRGVAFVPDAPTLVASGFYGLAAFRGGQALQEARGLASNGAVSSVPGGLLVFSTERHRLDWLVYGGFPPAARVDAKAAVFWAVEHDAAGRTVFAGGRDGKLYALDVATQRLTEATVHSDGIPSLLRRGDHLASASDDKTVAVWELPAMKLVRRTTAHRFLVNDLQVAEGAPGGPALVTSSSDALVKVWSWPGLEPRDTIDVKALTGKTSELHALWVASDLSRLLAGTWDGALLDVKRGPRGWSARRVEVPWGAVYRLAELPGLSAVAGVGIYPHGVFLYDLERGSVLPLEHAGLDAFWCVARPETNELFVVGDGGASRYAFQPGPGRLDYTLTTRRQSGVCLMSGTLLPDGTLWAATLDGALVKYGAGALQGPASFTGSVAR